MSNTFWLAVVSLVSLIGVPVVAQESAQRTVDSAIESAQEAGERAREAGEDARSQVRVDEGATSTTTRTRTATNTTTTQTRTSSLVTDLAGLGCTELVEAYDNNQAVYARTVGVINPLLTKFEVYIDEGLAVSTQNEELLEAYTEYNRDKVEFGAAGVRTESGYRLVGELECEEDADAYRGELESALALQAIQADTYTQLLNKLESTYTITD